MLKTRQAFKFKRLNEYRGAWETSGWLLTPKDVSHFHQMIESGLSFAYAFERITGHPFESVSDVSLIQEFLPEVANGLS